MQVHSIGLIVQCICDVFDISSLSKIEEMSWGGVAGWTGQGGSVLGTKRSVNGPCLLLLIIIHLISQSWWHFECYPIRTLPSTCMEKLVENLTTYRIQSLLVIGGFEVSIRMFSFLLRYLKLYNSGGQTPKLFYSLGL